MARLIVFCINKWINFDGFHIDYISNGRVFCTNGWNFNDGCVSSPYKLPCKFPWSNIDNILIPMWCSEVLVWRV